MEYITERDLYFLVGDMSELWKKSIVDGYNAVIELKLYDYIKTHEIESFMFDPPKKYEKEFEKLAIIADKRVGHSGASYGMTMRTVEYIIKNGFKNWKIEYIDNNNENIKKKIICIQKQMRECISNPEYIMCQRRLKYEFDYMR